MDEPSEEDIKKIVQEILKNGDLIPGIHARERMGERGYSTADIKHILNKGTLEETAVHKKQCRYTFCGEDLEGHPGKVVVELKKEKGKIIIITVT